MVRDSISESSDPTISSADLRLAWMPWVLPSVGDLFFVALFCLLVFTNLSSRLLGDAGIGWHIRTGQWILSSHRIPHFDPFSSSMNGRPWFAWEWLYDVLVGGLASLSGLKGVVVLTSLIIALTFWLAFRWLVGHGTNVLLALILVLLATSASMIHFFARPHVVSWLLTFVWFSILDSSEGDCVAAAGVKSEAYESKSSIYLWLLPLTILLWVNLHGGFLIGFVLLASYWASALWHWLRAGEDRLSDLLLKIQAGRRVRRLTLVGIVSAAATLVNPYGVRLYAHIYGYLSNRFLMDHIDEFQSPNFHYVAQKCFAGLLLLTLVTLAAGHFEFKRISVSHGMMLLFAVYSGLYASRNIPISSLLLILVIGPRLSNETARLANSYAEKRQRFGPAEFLRRMQKMELNLRGHLWPIAALVLTSWIVAHGGKFGASTVMHAQFSRKRFPVAAVDYIEQKNLKGPFFAPDYWGGYLIYRLYPRSKVVIDDRHDFYGEAFLRSYLKLMHVEPGWEEFLRQCPASYLVVPKNSAVANILTESPEWRSIYHDEVANVFVPAQANLAQANSE